MGLSVLAAFEEPALPLHTAGKYVAGAYIVLFVLVLIYVAIMAVRLGRIERDLGELLELSQRPGGGEPDGQASITPVHATSTDALAGGSPETAASSSR